MALTDISAQLLDLMQSDWPRSPTPFAEFGARLGASEEDVLECVRALQADGVIRQIGPIFDTKSLGYAGSLVAMRVAPDRLDAAAAAVGAHPGVSHNYAREHAFNLWFTIAVPPDSRLGLDRTVAILHRLARAESTRLLPTLRLFKIGVRLDMGGADDSAAKQQPVYSDASQHDALPPLTEDDIRLVQVLQQPLPVVPRPFDDFAAEAGVAPDALLAWLDTMKAQGRMRRFAAVLHHRKAGFAANGMGVWAAPEDRVDEIGVRMATFKAVSHCYHRPTYEDWPYNLFTMVHGRSQADVEAVLDEIATECGLGERLVLYSTTEYKKVRLQYFTPDLPDWESAHAADA